MKKSRIFLAICHLLAASFFTGCAGSSTKPAAEAVSEDTSEEKFIGEEGSVMRDLDGDGKEELLVGAIGNGVFRSYITQIYEVGEHENTTRFLGSDRDRLYLLDNGELLKEGASSAFASFWTIHTYENGELSFREGIIYDETLSSDYPWFAADTSEKAGDSISSEEFLERMNAYESRIQNPCLIAFSKKLSDTFGLNGRSAEKITLSVQHVSAKETEINDPVIIEKFMNLLGNVKIGERNDDSASDSDDVITCTFIDGSSVNIRFRNGKLAYGPKDECYELYDVNPLFNLYEHYTGVSIR